MNQKDCKKGSYLGKGFNQLKDNITPTNWEIRSPEQIVKELDYRKVIWLCGYFKTIVTVILTLAVTTIFTKLFLEDFELNPVEMEIVGFCIVVVLIMVGLILWFDGAKEKVKEKEHKLIKENTDNIVNEKNEKLENELKSLREEFNEYKKNNLIKEGE